MNDLNREQLSSDFKNIYTISIPTYYIHLHINSVPNTNNKLNS